MTENNKKLTPKQMKYCYHRHQGMSQRQAYKKAYDAENMLDKTIDDTASKLEAAPEITKRIEKLHQQAVEALHANEDFVLSRAIHEAKNAKEGGTRVGALALIAKVKGINTKDRPIADMTDEEIEAEIKASQEEQQPTVH